MGAYVAEQVPEKHIELLRGGCPVHAGVTVRDVKAARAAHPDAKLLVHPECVPAVVKMADYVGSTAGIMEYAKNSDEKEFIIGTEVSITEHLQFECPDKRFYNLSTGLVCQNMKITTLMDVYNSVNGIGGEVIDLDDETIRGAKKCIDEMIRLNHE